GVCLAPQKAQKSVSEHVIHLVNLNRRYQSSEDGVDQAPGIPHHQIGCVRFGQLTDASDRQKRQHQGTERVQDRTEKSVEEAENDIGKCVDDISNDEQQGSEHACWIAGDQSPESKLWILRHLLAQ